MGVDSYFNSAITIDPPVSEALIEEINASDDFYPWEIDGAGTAIETPPDGVRVYDEADERLTLLANHLLVKGHTVNGECFASNSEEVHWKYVIADNEVEVYYGFIAYRDGTTELPGVTVTIHQGEGS